MTSGDGGNCSRARSSSSFVSLILLTYVPFQRRSSLGDEDTHGRCLDSQDPPGLFGAEVEEIHEHDARPLPRREGAERLDHDLAGLDLGELVLWGGHPDRTAE